MDADDYESPYTTEAMLFGISAEGYQALNGVEKPKVTINYLDEKTGDVLGTLTYPDDYDKIFSDAFSVTQMIRCARWAKSTEPPKCTYTD